MTQPTPVTAQASARATRRQRRLRLHDLRAKGAQRTAAEAAELLDLLAAAVLDLATEG